MGSMAAGWRLDQGVLTGTVGRMSLRLHRHPEGSPRRANRAAIGVLAAVALLSSACTAKVSTAIAVSPSAATSIVVGVHFDGEIATRLAKDSSLRSQLQQVISTRLHQPVTLAVRGSGSGSDVSWSSAVSYAQLTANSDVTGVQSVVLSPYGAGKYARLTAVLVAPTAIDHAITAGTAAMKGATALATTMRTYTSVDLSVTFPGAVQVVAAPGVHPVVSGSTVTVSQALTTYSRTTLVVDGDLQGSSFPWLWVLGGVGAAAGIALLMYRRRRQYSEPELY